MNCLHCNKHMYNYFDGELSVQLKLEIDRHLSECPSCRFQYDLTIMENKVLRDTSDIPEISADFNKQVIASITPKKLPNLPDNVLVMSKDKRLHFRWSSIYTKSAIAVLLLALCFYVPGIIAGDQNQQKIAQNNNVPKLKLNSSIEKVAMKTGSTGDGMKQVGSNQKTRALKSVTDSPSMQLNSNDRSLAATPPLQLDASKPQPYESSRMACSERIESTSDMLPVSSLSLKNIPEKYKLVNKVNSIENQVEYSYQTDDGTETINIQLNTSPIQAPEISLEASSDKISDPIKSLAAPAIAENVNREIQVGDQKISVQVSGNISSEELNNLANQIVISKNR